MNSTLDLQLNLTRGKIVLGFMEVCSKVFKSLCFILFSSGYDLQPGKEGGTWLGLSAKDGVLKFGALLNITGETYSPDFLGEFFTVTLHTLRMIANYFPNTIHDIA